MPMYFTHPLYCLLLLVGLVTLVPDRSTYSQVTQDQLTEHKSTIDQALAKSWPKKLGEAKLENIRVNRDSFEKNLNKLKQLVKKSDLPAEAVGWIDEYLVDLASFKVSLESLTNGYHEVNQFQKDIVLFGDESIDEYLEDAIQQSAASFLDSKSKVEQSFENAKKKATAEYKEILSLKKRAVKELLAASKVDLNRREFQQLGESITGLMKQSANRLFDHQDRLEADPAYRMIMKGDASDLCVICIQGRIDEAMENLQTWRPLRLVLAADKGIENIRKVPKESGWIDVVVHGSANSVKLGSGQRAKADALLLFDLLNEKLEARDLSDWQRLHKNLDTGIRLISCNTGKCPIGFAQQLANLTGVKVKAPTGIATLVTYRGQTRLVVYLDKTHTRQGTWKTFSPNDDAKKELREKLYAKATQEKWWQVTLEKARDPRDKEATIKAMCRLNRRLSSSEAEELLDDPRGEVFIDSLDREDSIETASKLARLGITCRAEPMPRYKREFDGVDTSRDPD